MKSYYSIFFLERELKTNRSLIYKSLIKNGYSAFSLEIMEYCEPDKVINREQYYLDLLNPEYNILTTAGSSLGRKHSEDTKVKLRAIALAPKRKELLKILHANEELQAKRLERLKVYNASEKHKEHLEKLSFSTENIERLLRYSKSLAKRVEVLDTDTSEKTVYPSVSEAARAIGCTSSSIFTAFQRQKEKGID
jgi:group I intron endonuclease